MSYDLLQGSVSSKCYLLTLHSGNHASSTRIGNILKPYQIIALSIDMTGCAFSF
jgi:hypothetical protein